LKWERLARNLTTLLLLIAVVVLGTRIDWEGLVKIIKAGDTLLLSLAVLIAVTRFFIWTFKWRSTISSLAELSYPRVFAILMTGVLMNQLTPGRDTGGEPIRAYYVSKLTGLAKRKALATIIIDKSGNYIAVSSFIGYSLLFIALFIKLPGSVKAFLELLLILLFLIAISAVYVRKNLALPGAPASLLRRVYYLAPLSVLRERFPSYAGFEAYVMERFTEFITTLKDLIRDRRNIVNNLLLSYLIWFLVFFKTYLILLSFGAEVSMPMVIAVESMSILLGIFSILPGGAGATEIAMIALFTSAGVDVETATAATLVSRGIFYALTLGLGSACFTYLRFFAGEVEEEHAPQRNCE